MDPVIQYMVFLRKCFEKSLIRFSKAVFHGTLGFVSNHPLPSLLLGDICGAVFARKRPGARLFCLLHFVKKRKKILKK
jgi:hypothetical protein